MEMDVQNHASKFYAPDFSKQHCGKYAHPGLTGAHAY